MLRRKSYNFMNDAKTEVTDYNKGTDIEDFKKLGALLDESAELIKKSI